MDNTKDKELAKIRVLKLGENLLQQKYNEELSREQSLLTQAAQMQTAFSVITAALFMLLPILIDNRGTLDLTFIFIFVSIITLFLLVSFVLALLAQWRFKIRTLSGSDIQNNIIDSINELLSEEKIIVYKTNLLKKLQTDRFKANEKRVFYITISMIAFYLSIFLCLIFFVTSIVILL
ncbi:hypothetical protein ACRQU7_12165 [Caproiciproducens sp. R1]|uniref:hypothetical protein n=1 Tax=Caproiciproducens sp. R1 TaxID=3435000 RepID=UPI0040336775